MTYFKWCFVAMLLVIFGGCENEGRHACESAAKVPEKNCPTTAELVSGLDRMSHPEWLAYLLPDGTITKQFAAYDLAGGNWDGAFSNAFVMYREANGEVVIFDEYGPGCLTRQQLNVWLDGNGGLYPQAGKCRLKYYFDDEKTPRLDITADDFFGGKVAPFTAPFNFMDARSAQPAGSPMPLEKRFGSSFYPMPFKKRLKITVTTLDDWSKRNTTWYQYAYLAFPTAEGVTTWPGPSQDSQLLRRQWTNLGTDPKPTQGNVNVDSQKTIEPGITQTIFERNGQNSIAVLKFKLEPYNKDTFFNTNIMIYWDNQKSPSVSLPIGYLFGGGGKDYPYAAEEVSKTLKNLFYGFDSASHTFYCYWPMPFWSNAKIDIQNSSGSAVTLDTHIELKGPEQCNYPKGEAGYFCAKRTVYYDYGSDPFINVFKESGRGHAVGISFFTHGYAMDGDEYTYLDDSRTPQIHGSGTEDDHNQGWGGSAYQKPLWGGLFNGYEGAYRIYMGEPYIFYDNININYELVGSEMKSRSDVVFFYYKSSDKSCLRLSDELDVGKKAAESAHKYRIKSQTWEKCVKSSYDGYERQRNYDTVTDDGRAFKRYSEFTAAIDPANNGVKIRKRLSRYQNGLQRVTVYVDGKKVTERPWHYVQPSTSPAEQSWADTDFQIPASYTRGKSSIRLRMEYAQSNKYEVNEFYYWIYSLVPGQDK